MCLCKDEALLGYVVKWPLRCHLYAAEAAQVWKNRQNTRCDGSSLFFGSISKSFRSIWIGCNSTKSTYKRYSATDRISLNFLLYLLLFYFDVVNCTLTFYYNSLSSYSTLVDLAVTCFLVHFKKLLLYWLIDWLIVLWIKTRLFDGLLIVNIMIFRILRMNAK